MEYSLFPHPHFSRFQFAVTFATSTDEQAIDLSHVTPATNDVLTPEQLRLLLCADEKGSPINNSANELAKYGGNSVHVIIRSYRALVTEKAAKEYRNILP